jgi:hypothetical protein
LPATISIGFVPTLEVLPLLAELSGTKIWRTQPCPSYGRVIRHLLTGELDAGVVPWELGITELVTKPAQQKVWRVPLVLHACPTELVLSHKATKVVYPGKLARKGKPHKLVFGIEARCSLTRYQILDWQSKVAGPHLEQPAFKVLPMELFRKALEAETIDGMVAPSPWGLQAETDGAGRVDPKFTPGANAQELVLICRREVTQSHAANFSELPARLAEMHRQLEDSKEFMKQAKAMARLGPPRCDPLQLEAAAQLHLKGVSRRDHQPDRAWLEAALKRLAELLPLETPLDFSGLADTLAPAVAD